MSASPEQSPVLIIGAGPTGLVSALSLLMNGIPVRIIDNALVRHQAARGSGLQPRTMEHFRVLGIYDDISRQGGPLAPLKRHQLPGAPEIPEQTWSLLGDRKPTPDAPEVLTRLNQYETEAILRNHIAKYGVSVEMGTEPISLEQDDNGVTVAVKKTAPDGSQTTDSIRAPYVMGADGARGFTRRAMGAKFEGQTKEEDGHVWADVVIEGLTTDFWHVWPQPGKFTISIRPKGGPQEFAAGIIGSGFDPIDLVDEHKFAEFITKTTGENMVFKKFTSLTYWKPKMRMVNKFSEGRVFIAGDAAHIHSPTGGQGLNTSVQDSINWAWKLALVYKGLAPQELLSTYQIERAPIVAMLLDKTTKLYDLAVARNNDPEAAAKFQASGLLRWRDPSLTELKLNYRWSPIVYDERGTIGFTEDEMKARAYDGYPGEDVHAGDRAPDAPELINTSGAKTRLLDIFKPNVHTVLVFVPRSDDTAAAESAASALQTLPAGTVQTVLIGRDGVPQAVPGTEGYHDSQGHAHNAYHVENGKLTIVVVRPDTYVGGLVYGVDGLRAYFAKIFLLA